MFKFQKKNIYLSPDINNIVSQLFPEPYVSNVIDNRSNIVLNLYINHTYFAIMSHYSDISVLE